MQMVVAQDISPYEAFMQHGLASGDSLFADMIMDAVISALYELGYEVEQEDGPHNQAIRTLVARDGTVIDLFQVADAAGIDLEESPAAVRRALLAAGLHDVVQALDEMDRLELDPPPAVVVVRRPSQGDVVDVRLFATAAEAAAFALQHEDEELDVLLPLPPEQRTAACRYRQAAGVQELKALAGGGPQEG